MVCLVTFECVATPGNGDTVFKKLKELLPNTRNKEGFIDLVAHIDQDDRDRLLCVQHWENRDAYESYVNWRKSNGDLDVSGNSLGGIPLAETPKIRFFDITDA